MNNALYVTYFDMNCSHFPNKITKILPLQNVCLVWGWLGQLCGVGWDSVKCGLMLYIDLYTPPESHFAYKCHNCESDDDV